jgi:hypothetical protein
MFSFTNGPEIETVSSGSEFFGDTLDMWDNNHALLYCILRREVASQWLHYRVNEFFWELILGNVVF